MMGSILLCCLPCAKAGGLQILCCQGFEVNDYNFTLDVLALKPSSFCNVRVKSKDKSIRFVGNATRDVSNQRLKDSKSAVDEFFRQLPLKSGIDAKKILFVLDGKKPSLYSEYGLVDAKDQSILPESHNIWRRPVAAEEPYE